jgi:uncharacterized protein (DUF849 family)
MSSKKVIINFCPTGMVPQKKVTPHVPVSPEEIIEQTHQAFEVGITIVHVHAREVDGNPSWKPEIYHEIIEGIRKHCPGLVICASTSGRNVSEFEKRSAVIELKPDMCSLTLSSLNFFQQASVNEPEMIHKLAEKMVVNGVHPELECFDLGMINYGNYLIKKGVIKKPFYWNLIFGNIAGFQPKPHHIAAAVHDIPESHYVAFGGIGKFQSDVLKKAISEGFGVRTGLEDNIWLDDNQTELATNLQLLKQVHIFLEDHGRELMPSKNFGMLGFYNSAIK